MFFTPRIRSKFVNPQPIELRSFVAQKPELFEKVNITEIYDNTREMVRLSDEEIQRKILEFLYNAWQSDPFRPVYLKKLIQDGLFKITEQELYRNAEYLASKGFIKRPRTLSLPTQITSYGIDRVEDKRLSPDVEIRRKFLQVLKEAFDEDPHQYLSKGDLISQTGFSEIEILRNIKYLGDKGKAKTGGVHGRDFSAKITALGIDNLKEPSLLEKETRFMSSAYLILYRLENELRIFIERKLREKFDGQWWERGVSREIRENAEKRKMEEPNSTLSLINYTEFGDLRKIIQNNWDVFEATFKTQLGIVARLDELEPLRNIIAHTRLLSNDEFKKLELFYKEIRELIA